MSGISNFDEQTSNPMSLATPSSPEECAKYYLNLKELVKRSYEPLAHGDFSIEPVEAGLTNKLFKIKSKRNTPDCYLLRIYGSSSAALYDRVVELKVFKILSKAKLAPLLLASFSNGRIESWIYGECLNKTEYCQVSTLAKVAELICKVHMLRDNYAEIRPFCVGKPRIWLDLLKWADTVEKKYKDAHKELHDLMPFSIIKDPNELQISEYIRETRKACAYLDTIREDPRWADNEMLDCTFCHNDVHSQNIMKDLNNDLHLLDYEYSGYNYPAYDFAVLFTEATTDYTISEPPYFEYKHLQKDFPDYEFIVAVGRGYYQTKLDKTAEISDERLKSFYNATVLMSLYVQLFSVYWGLINARNSLDGTKFDFLLFVKMKFESYHDIKRWLIHNSLINDF